MAKKAKKATKKAKLTPAERAQAKIKSDHIKLIRGVFAASGFVRVDSLSDREFNFQGQPSDFDDVFVFENIIIFSEYTARTTGVGDHLKSKKIVYDKVLSAPEDFLAYLKSKFPTIKSSLAANYHPSKIVIRILYCSRYDLNMAHKSNVPGPIYMDYPFARYFASVAKGIKKSARFELLHFLEVENSTVGENGKIVVGTGSQDFNGSILPEAHSNFDDGYKVVSFYASPEALLRRVYVLRKDGWRESANLYQRMISPKKIDGIRTYLKTQRRVFVNNIIVTLPSDVKPLDDNGNTIDTKKLTSTSPVIIKLPDQQNSVGIIDGQHRVFAYHETVKDDQKIAQLRGQQNLLVTGIIYPNGMSDLDREKFEARLFLEINATQTNAKGSLKQAVGLVIEPFATDSIAARVLTGLALTGPLEDRIERYFFDKGKLKTSSIVSYALRPLVKTSGSDSLFSIWTEPNKADLLEKKDNILLESYIKYCVQTINILLVAIKLNINSARWSTDPKITNRVLTTTYVNSFLIILRLLIEKGIQIEQNYLSLKLKKLEDLDFSAYRSSQYKRMAEKIVSVHFS